MSNLLDKWNKNKFSVYDSEEKSTLELMEKLSAFIKEEVIKEVDNKVSQGGDFWGTWQGIAYPTLSEEGLRGTVERNVLSISSNATNINKINNKIELNIKDFGAKGDGITNDTQAFKDAFAYIKNMQTDIQYSKGCVLKIPYGTYIISEGFEVDCSVGLVGEGMIKTSSYRLFGANAHNQDMSPNCTTIKYDTPKNNMTMFKPVFSNIESADLQYRKDFYMENIMLDGSDGQVISSINPTGKGTKDLTIVFTGTNSNGLDMSNVRFMRGSSNVYIVGFSGFGLKTYHWQTHHLPTVSLCKIGIITGGDGSIVSPLVTFCQNGVQIGETGLLGATDRLDNIRVEWCEEYGVNVINGGNNRISGFIDRCGYSGYCQGVDTWGMNVDLTIQRCGCVWRGGTKSDLTTKDLKKQGSNVYINNPRGGNFRFSNLRSGSRDTSESDDYKAPVLATALIGAIDYVMMDSPQGFSGAFFDDYYLEGNTNGTIISNGKIHSDFGIKVSTENNKPYIDLFNGYRFRPTTNWGKPSDSVGVSGDIMFDSQNNVMYYKNATTWVQM